MDKLSFSFTLQGCNEVLETKLGKSGLNNGEHEYAETAHQLQVRGRMPLNIKQSVDFGCYCIIKVYNKNVNMSFYSILKYNDFFSIPVVVPRIEM